jgi:hypothetical protein
LIGFFFGFEELLSLVIAIIDLKSNMNISRDVIFHIYSDIRCFIVVLNEGGGW